MKRKYILLCILWCGFILMFVPEKNYQREIADEIFRFHVVANSNSIDDQALKLEVRDCVIDFLSRPLSGCKTREESEKIIRNLLPEIEAEAAGYIQSRGYDYEVSACVGEQYFPVKTYGDMTFPRGYYDALTIDIGSGSGRNWWCVLFPNLCFTNAVTADIPEESQVLLKNSLGNETYDSLYDGRKVELRFKILEFAEDYLGI